jgi:acetyl-CoA C-acetyltransferase
MVSIKNKAYIVGAFKHPTRRALDKFVVQLRAEVAKGALQDSHFGWQLHGPVDKGSIS